VVTSSSPAVLKRWIAQELKRLRKEAGLTQKDAATRIGRSQQHVGYLESARNLPSAGDLEILLGLYGMADRIDFMRELLTATKRGRNWWASLRSAVPPAANASSVTACHQPLREHLIQTLIPSCAAASSTSKSVPGPTRPTGGAAMSAAPSRNEGRRGTRIGAGRPVMIREW